MDHFVVIWKRVNQGVPCFQRFDTDELAQERLGELLENAFVDTAYVQAMDEEGYAAFLRLFGLWEKN